MQKQNIELLTDLYRKFAQFIYAVRTKYFAMDIKYSMLMSVPCFQVVRLIAINSD